MRFVSLLAAATFAVTACQLSTDAGAGKNSRAWQKICENGICNTLHEKVDFRTGKNIYSARVRETAGSKRRSLIVAIPNEMVAARGLRAAVFTKEQWRRKLLKQSVISKELREFELKFSPCDENGCSAEVEATPRLIEDMKAGGGLVAVAINAMSQRVAFSFPLDGFGEALDGPPVDTALYRHMRGVFVEGMRRQPNKALPPPQSLHPDDPPPMVGHDGLILRK